MLRHVGSSSLTRNQTWAACIRSEESSGPPALWSPSYRWLVESVSHLFSCLTLATYHSQLDHMHLAPPYRTLAKYTCPWQLHWPIIPLSFSSFFESLVTFVQSLSFSENKLTSRLPYQIASQAPVPFWLLSCCSLGTPLCLLLNGLNPKWHHTETNLMNVHGRQVV